MIFKQFYFVTFSLIFCCPLNLYSGAPQVNCSRSSLDQEALAGVKSLSP